MLKLEIGLKFKAKAGNNVMEFMCIACNQLESPPTFICRATGNFLREFYEHGMPCCGNVWTAFEEPPKPRTFWIAEYVGPLANGSATFHLYKEKPFLNDCWKAIKAVEVLTSNSSEDVE